MAAQKRIARFGIALDGYVRPLDALSLRDLLHHDIRRGRACWRAIIDLAGVRLGIGEKLAERLPWGIASDYQTGSQARNPDDIGEINDPIVPRFCHERQTKNARMNLRDGVAVWLGGSSHLCRTERAS